METKASLAPKTERLTLLLSRDDKRIIEERARAANMSVGEYMRRAGQTYEPELDYETLEQVVRVWHEDLQHMRKTLSETFKQLDKNRAEMNRLRSARHGLG